MRRRGLRADLRVLVTAAALLVAAGVAAVFLFPRYRTVEDLSCGPPDCLVDLYLPRSRGTYPVIVFFHGGGWQSGNRKGPRDALAGLAGQGFMVVTASYRLFPAARFPDFVEDGARAVSWAKRHAHEWGGDPDRLFLAGFSAGAHIAAMLAFDRRWLAGVSLDSGRDVAGLIGLAGPYLDFPPHVPNLTEIFGGAEARASALPAQYADAGDPPALLISGDRDAAVPASQAVDFAALIRSRGGRAEARIYPGVDHDGLPDAFAFPRRLRVPALRDVASFVERPPPLSPP